MAVKMHRLMLHASFCLLFVTANAEDCSTEGNVRLVSADGVAENEGRVEVCVNGVWGTVCDDRWGASDARVVCHQLGLVADYADAIYRYNPGSGPIHFSGFHCFGNENRLFDCAIEQNSKNVTLCGHNQDAGVRCPRVPCRDNDVRLNGGNVVQVCFNQQWGLVCEHLYSWSSIDAGVVCDQVGIHSQLPRAARRPRQPYDASVVLSGVRCTGSETRLTNCSVMQRDDFDACEYVAVAQCEVKESCEVPNSIRLTTTWFRNRTIGRLEMCSGNVWGTVCGNGAARAIAVVACRELNHAANGTLFLERILSFVPPLIPITRTNMVCSGNETNLANCSFDGVYGDANCQHRDDLFITCMARQCTENNIRLRGGHENYYGRVEICLHGLWGTVCGDRWDSREAAVVCRQLHLYGSSYTLKSFPNPDGLPIHLDNVNCQGNESMLNECSHPGIGNENCAEGYEEAGVICTDVMCEDGAVHLVGGSDISRGRVEFCYRGKWYTVCASTWRDSGYEARVVCKTLDYNVFRYGEFISNFGRGFSPILPYQIKCGVDDLSLKQCTKTGFDTSECEHVAGVICGADCQSSGITDCTVCGDRVGCRTQYNCNCHSRCYEFGDCCPDVSTLKNCVVKECESGEIRLVGGLTNSVGRLELCANGIWGRVCNRLQYWGPVNAKVVCRQLGFSEVGSYVVDNATLFGESERNAVMGEVHCTGDEPELLECSHTDIGRHLCGSQFNPVPDIAISCYDEVSSCEEGEVRLSKNSSGHVEYCQHRTWGAVCSEGWDDIDAGVACSQLGFNPADAIAKGNFSLAESIPIFLSQVECNGSEIGLKDCVKTMPNARCEFAAGVMCKRSSPNSGAEKGAEKGVAVAGSVIGGVLGSIIVIVLIIGVLLRYRKFKIQERNQFLNYQLGILTRPQSGGTNRPQQEHTTQTYDDGINCSLGVKPDENPQMVSSEKHIPMAAESSTSDNNCYANNQPSCHQSVSRTRVYSHHLRELTRGKFIVKKADITLLEIIGEGC
ncbi:Deleted in malignant brain tumors 1 protein [Geodia barretti]|uniref:Deleted in malignant brain tumors 1 protein n=1 Tax=Geodia barretti TaxID=519541 RepID=A0AA35XB15_GEOBA|nr:Deleted in malignant brain tumors 1 protein [Geodia barretti]